MASLLRARKYGLVFNGWLVLLAAPFFLSLAGLSVPAGVWLTFTIAIPIAVAHVHILRGSPKPDRELAQKRLREGTLALEEPGRRSPVWGPSLGVARSAASVVAALLCAAITAPEIMRHMRGWPRNANTFPPVAGPGDTVRCDFPGRISSIRGYWGGSGSAQWLGPRGPVAWRTSSSDRSWPETLYVRPDEKWDDSTVYLDVWIPDPPELAWTSVDLRLRLRIEYPWPAMSDRYEVRTAEKSTVVTLRLGDARAGSFYARAFYAGTVAGTCLLFALSVAVQVMLYRHARRDPGIAVPGPSDFRESPSV